MAANTAATMRTARQGSAAKLLISCGRALPSVSAPMSTPRAHPRPVVNHDVIIFNPVG